MDPEPRIFDVCETGERTVVLFLDSRPGAGRFDPLESVYHAAQQEIGSLVAEHHCRTLALDFSTVDFLPSVFLGLFVALLKTGVKIELLHTSPHIRDMLAVTKLDRLFTIRD